MDLNDLKKMKEECDNAKVETGKAKGRLEGFFTQLQDMNLNEEKEAGKEVELLTTRLAKIDTKLDEKVKKIRSLYEWE